MTDIFLKTVNMSICAGWLVLAVIALRFLMRGMPKWVNVLLWGIVAVRLLCPFSIESTLSLIPSAETISPEIMLDATPEISTGVAVLNRVVNPVISQSFAPNPFASANPLQIWIPVAAVFWLSGIVLLTVYTAFTYWRLRRKVFAAVRLADNIYRSGHIASPFVLGIIRPRIYLPCHMAQEDVAHVIAHEKTHISRKDHWWKPLGFLLLTVHWFNPLLWIAYMLLCRDIELACDEKVIGKLARDQRADYSQALLNCSVSRRMIVACPLAFGEVGVKERVKNVFTYRKPAFWIILLSIVLCVAVAVCFLTDPLNSTVRNPWVQEYEPGQPNMVGAVDKSKYEEASPDFAIGADCYGRAVFKDPRKAFDTLKELYAVGIGLIRQEFDLAPLSNRNYDAYKTYGWQVTGGTEEARSQAAFVSGFLDIYENSFSEDTAAGSVLAIDGFYHTGDGSYRYYLTIRADNVQSIGVSMPDSSGCCQNADGSLFENGERVYLEPLDGLHDLQGVTVTANDAEGNTVFTMTVPEGSPEDVNVAACDGWLLAPDTLKGLTPVTFTADVTEPEPSVSAGNFPETFDLEREFTVSLGYASLETAAESTEIVLRNLHNGNATTVRDPDRVQEILEFIASVKGVDPISSRGYYGGCYEVSVYRDGEKVFGVGFGDDNTLNYGTYTDGYPARYQLENMTTADVAAFFSRFDKTFDWGITLTAEDVTAEGLTLVCTHSGGIPTGELHTGSMFGIEKYVGGQWVSVEPQQENLAWDGLAYLINPNETVTWGINWAFTHGALPDGHYRIRKEIMNYRAPGDYDAMMHYAEFTVG